MAISERILDEVLRHAAQMLRVRNGFTRGTMVDLNAIIDKAHDRVLRRLPRLARVGNDPQLIREIVAEVRALLSEDFDAMYLSMRDGLYAVALAEATWLHSTISPLVEEAIVGAQLHKTPAAAARSTALTPYNGRATSNWVRSVRDGFLQGMRDALVIGAVAGDSALGLERRLTGAPSQRGAGGVYGRTRRQTRGVANSAFIHVTNQNMSRYLEENADHFSGVMWSSALDSHVCVVCAALDGSIYEVAVGPRPPAHFNCRCQMIPVVRGEPLPSAPSFLQWLRRQNHSVQDEVLGKRKAAAWRSGQVRVDDFVVNDTDVLTLEQLGLDA